MDKEYYCVIVGKEKYKELLEQLNNMKDFIMYPPNEDKKEYIAKVNTLYGLPVKISPIVDEKCMKMMTKEEYEEFNKIELNELENFMEEYEPDYMWK